MSLKAEIKDAVGVLEQLQTALVKCDDPRTRVKCHDDLNAIMGMLKNPMLHKIVAIQEALQTLKAKVAHHPSLLPEDFDISVDGKLIHSSAVDDVDETFIAVQEPVVTSTKTSIDSQSHFSICNDDEFSSSNSTENRRLESMRTASVSSPPKQSTEVLDHNDFLISSNELKSQVERSAEDKQIHHVRLSKPEGTNLGFSVVGLKSELRGDLGIYIKDIQPSGIAGQDGRLQDGDQILAIDGKIIDAFISHQKAISILQNASNVIDLYVARDPSAQAENEINNKNLENQQSKANPFYNTHIVPPSNASHTSNMVGEYFRIVC